MDRILKQKVTEKVLVKNVCNKYGGKMTDMAKKRLMKLKKS